MQSNTTTFPLYSHSLKSVLGFDQRHGTLLHINAIVERANSLEGVHRALEAEDYESVARYVQTFLQIDAQYKDSGSDQVQRDRLLAAKKQLEGIVRKKLSAAVDQRDHPAIPRFGSVVDLFFSYILNYESNAYTYIHIYYI